MSAETPINYVRLMREIRDQVNREIAGMTYEEEQRWMQDQLAAKNKLSVAPARPSGHAYPNNLARHDSAEGTANDQ
jgi:hypothetical protein